MDHWAARRGSGRDGSGPSTRPAFGLGGGGPRCSMCPQLSLSMQALKDLTAGSINDAIAVYMPYLRCTERRRSSCTWTPTKWTQPSRRRWKQERRCRRRWRTSHGASATAKSSTPSASCGASRPRYTARATTPLEQRPRAL